jgi:hypothetical protein
MSETDTPDVYAPQQSCKVLMYPLGDAPMWTILVIAVGLSGAAGLAVVGHAWYVIHQERLRLH